MLSETHHQTPESARHAERASWQAFVAPFQQPSTPRAVWQLINTVAPYTLLWVVLYLTLGVSLWLTIPLLVLASGFLVRVFIIFHDCGHGSYLSSQKANQIAGFFTGVLTFSPYLHWRWEHSIHHRSAGHLDKRGIGDIWTMTVQEYLDASRARRLHYRFIRNPFVLLILAPFFVFVIKHRFPCGKAPRAERRSVWWTNLCLLAVVACMSWMFGFTTYVLLQGAMLMLSGAAGLWLFYVQHQFEGVYWERGQSWNYTAAALQGSSFYKLPRVLQWFSGNIGFHHVHHLSPRVANYNLQKCHESAELFQQVKAVTLSTSFKSLSYHLWDEQRRKLVSFSHIARTPRGKG
jgi:acyl-lipid omega-6 desaturase (Delta-12 desaturase)